MVSTQHRRLLAVWLGALFLGVVSKAATLVATQSVWRAFKGTSDPSPQTPLGWTAREFNDSNWTVANASFFYGETGYVGTELSDMQNAYGTLFLRKTFTVANPALLESLELNAICDDGFIAWINGRRVAQLNPPAGDPRFDSLASANIAEPIAFTPYPIAAPEEFLVQGENTLAILVLNTATSSSDLVFDAELTSKDKPGSPPVVIAIDPPPGLITNLTTIEVTFSKPVTGVEASQFLVNEKAATSVTGSGASYRFNVSQPSAGLALITWGPLHKIQDTETPPHRFPQGGPGSSWTYQVLDPAGPVVSKQFPPPGLRLRNLSQVELSFNMPVMGLDAKDLLLNERPAVSVEGIGAGPYRFQFSTVSDGPVVLRWAEGHGIVSDEPVAHPFTGTGWSYTVDRTAPVPNIRITELLAENLGGKKDEDADPEDWIELYNAGTEPVNLLGWSLSNDRDMPDQWIFPDATVAAGGRLVVWASGKDRSTPGKALHTNFKLNPAGDTVRLFGPEYPRVIADQVAYPEQGPDYSYGRQTELTGEVWRYFEAPTPGFENGRSGVTNTVGEVHFSVERGFFDKPFNLTLAVPTPGAVIRYTTNGSPPLGTNGFLYIGPIPIGTSKILRAAATLTNHLPSRVQTHTYLYGLPTSRKLIPALSLVTSSNNLYGRTGIMEYSPRNTDKHGPAWERPVSAEWIQPDGTAGFQVDCGIRVQGGGYIRGLYNYRAASPPENKYSFRLYFRGEYGQGRLKQRLFPNTTLDEFDTIVLRAGMNDHTNPFIKDEFNRTLAGDVGQPASHGTFVNLFLNGVYKGYYNPTERIDIDFLQAYHGGGRDWDVVASMSERREGDLTAWNKLLSAAASKPSTNQLNYLDFARQLDLTNFVDYLLMPIYVDADDWPHNNWRAARERTPQGRFRFYAWDVEWSFGDEDGHDVAWNTITGQIANTAPPWGGIEIQRIFNNLKRSPEFRLLFADRVHRAYFNGGALTDENIRRRWEETRAKMTGTISSIANKVGTVYLPRRRAHVLRHLHTAGFLASSNAPGLNRLGGSVPAGFTLVLTNLAGAMYYTTDGSDPRVAFTGDVAVSAKTYTAPLILTEPLALKARSLQGTNWSAVVEATFQIANLESPLRLTEIMYNPPGGDAYEFLEFWNSGGGILDLSDHTLGGVNFRFKNPGPKLGPGERLVLANDAKPSDFARRYPGVVVAGWFGGSLDNGGETLRVFNPVGQTVLAVTYGDGVTWPATADGSGASLEWTGAVPDSNDPFAWRASAELGGSPGLANAEAATPTVRFNEVLALSRSGTDWVELANVGNSAVSVADWWIMDRDQSRRYRLPATASIPSKGFLRIACSTDPLVAGLNTGFNLDAEGDSLVLLDRQTNRVDGVAFGPQMVGFSVGRLGSTGQWSLCEPTPSGPNESAPQGVASDVVLNEILANGDGEDDWIEAHNRGGLPINLMGWHLTTSNAVHRIAVPVFIGPKGHAVLRADEQPEPGHLPFKLPASGGVVALLDSQGVPIDRVVYGAQLPKVTWGRLPDGTGDWLSLPFSASPRAANYQAELGRELRLAEFMAANDSAVTNAVGWICDWIEIENVGGRALDLSNFSLSVGQAKSGEWTFPPGVRLEIGARLVVWCNELEPPSDVNRPVLNLGRSLPREGSALTVFDDGGRVLDQVQYGTQIPNLTSGRDGAGWSLLRRPTPGVANAPAATLGDVSKLRLNEWLAEGGQLDDFVEIANLDTLPVELSGAYLTDDPSISGAVRFKIAPLTFIAGNGFLRFVADGNPSKGTDHLNFQLHPLGETLRLVSPSRVTLDSVDFIAQVPGASEGRFPDGSANLVRFVGSASPGASNWIANDDQDGDGLPDGWELQFGLNPGSAADAMEDRDGDGVNTRDEYRAGTDPTNPASLLQLTFGVSDSGEWGLEFEAAAGRSYSLLSRETSEAAVWIKVMDIPAGAIRSVRLPLPVPAGNSAALYYRLATPSTP